MDNVERIKKAFCDVDFENYEEVLYASKEIKDIDPKEVIDWISKKLETKWHWCEVINDGGVQNIEKIFGCEFDLKVLINVYFTTVDHWFYGDGRDQWINEFIELTGKKISANDVVENLDVNFFDKIGLDELISFTIENGGDPKLIIKRIAPIVERLSHIDIEDVVYNLDSYIEDDDIDMEKLFSRINWNSISDEEEIEEFIKFFNHHAPKLVSKIPA